MDNLGRVRLGYSRIRMSSGGVTKTLSPKTQTSDPENSDPRIYFQKIYTVNSSEFLSPNVWADNLWSRNLCSFATAKKKQDISLFRFISVALVKQWKTNKVENSSQYFNGICWRIFLPKKQKTQSRYNVVQVLQVEDSFESTGRNSDKPKRINISILSGFCCLWTL